MTYQDVIKGLRKAQHQKGKNSVIISRELLGETLQQLTAMEEYTDHLRWLSQQDIERLAEARETIGKLTFACMVLMGCFIAALGIAVLL